VNLVLCISCVYISVSVTFIGRRYEMCPFLYGCMFWLSKFPSTLPLLQKCTSILEYTYMDRCYGVEVSILKTWMRKIFSVMAMRVSCDVCRWIMKSRTGEIVKRYKYMWMWKYWRLLYFFSLTFCVCGRPGGPLPSILHTSLQHITIHFGEKSCECFKKFFTVLIAEV
jgi:hypothetical protein